MIARWFLRATLLTVSLGAFARAGAPDGRLTYEHHVRPILKAHCFHCHGEEEKPKGGLDLRLVRLMKQGGKSGEAIATGPHEESLLWERIDADEMPPGEKKLTAKEKETIASWIDQGATAASVEPTTLPPGVEPTEQERSFWSFQPILRPELPGVKSPQMVRTPIDAFLLNRLESQGLSFAPEADKTTLIRRATFDLTGLPPSPEDVDRFLADSAPDAYERLVDRLLGSPHYGERWARHWLDVAGYADSDGYTPHDAERKYAYKYRDYLVRSLNADRPWDDLIREQLAGDEMLAPPYVNLKPADLDKLIATGFLRMAPDGTSDGSTDPNTARNDVVAETIKIVSTSMLGLTVGCAQCHAHRYDPIPQADYYRFRALFEPALDWKNWRVPNARLISLWTDADRKRAGEVDAEIAKITQERTAAIAELVKKVLERELAAAPADLRDKLRAARETVEAKRNDEQKQLLKTYPKINVNSGNVSLYDQKAHLDIINAFTKRIDAAKTKRPPEDFVQVLTEVPGKVSPTFLFYRGDIQQPRQPVEPGELSILRSAETLSIPVDDPHVPTTGRRLAYARHLTSGKHPLLARVLVNRLWLDHFGRGIVNTPGDFGMLGERPSHPELLDWLADEFMRGGWTLKRLHRMLVLSTAYRQTSVRTARLDAIDPDNRLLGRMPVRRLEAEAVRDAILAVSGDLDARMFGPPVPVTVDDVGQVIVGIDTRDSAGRPSGKKVSLGAEEYRRSLFVQVRRSLPLSMLETFDAPVMVPNCERRTSSTVAPQSLLLMNNEFVIAESESFAGRVEKEAGDNPIAQVRHAWRLALSSDPSRGQVEWAAAFLIQQRADFKAASSKDPKGPSPSRRALASFCQALLSSNAFLYVD